MTGLSHYFTQTPVLLLFLICHFLSDFQLQSQKVANRKNKDLSYLAIHILWVTVPLLICVILQPAIWWMAGLIIISHGLIDYAKPTIAHFFKLSRAGSFILDQSLHLAIILGLSPFYRNLALPDWLPISFLTTLFFIILISKPTNIAFRIFFKRFQPSDVNKMDTIPQAGATIGLLERIVIGICIALGQFASIGLVFTAKSIARYNKISESPAFAEYYLIGSLFSILSVLLAAWICFY